MEGTRHERAAIVIASYIIGFITAFMFSANTGDIAADHFTSVETSNSAAVAQAEPEVIAPVATTKPEWTLTYEDGRLVYAGVNGEHLLSFNPEISSLTVDLSTLTQGYHYGELSYAVSASGQFVFFCERGSEAEDTCAGYVYDANAGKIFQITMEGEPLTFFDSVAREASWTAVGLKVGSNYSVNVSAPWVMMTTEGTLDLQ